MAQFCYVFSSENIREHVEIVVADLLYNLSHLLDVAQLVAAFGPPPLVVKIQRLRREVVARLALRENLAEYESRALRLAYAAAVDRVDLVRRVADGGEAVENHILEEAADWDSSADRVHDRPFLYSGLRRDPSVKILLGRHLVTDGADAYTHVCAVVALGEDPYIAPWRDLRAEVDDELARVFQFYID